MNRSPARLHLAASSADVDAVQRLRYEVYVEGERLFENEVDPESRRLGDEYDAVSDILVAEIDGRLAGTIRLTRGGTRPFSAAMDQTCQLKQLGSVVSEGEIAVVTRLAVRREFLGLGLGSRLFREAVARAASFGIEVVLGMCEPQLVDRYWKLGFRPYGRLYDHPGNGALVSIANVVRDFEHQRRLDPLTELPPTPLRPDEAERIDRLAAIVSEQRPFRSETIDGADGCWRELAAQTLASTGQLPDMLAKLSPAEATELLTNSYLLDCGGGVALFHPGRPARILYLLVSGSLELWSDGAPTERFVNQGTRVGEDALRLGARCTNTLRAGPAGACVLALRSSTVRVLLRNTSANP